MAAALVGTVLVLAACLYDARSSVASRVDARQRVVLVSYVDDPADTRGYRDFAALGKALRRLDRDVMDYTALDFEQISVTGTESLTDALKRVIATGPSAIVATSDDVVEAARETAGPVPVLFASHADPVAAGYVRSIAQPGVPRTGFTYHVALTQKMLELLVDAYPHVRRIGVLADPMRSDAPGFRADTRIAAERLGIEVSVFIATNVREAQRAMHSARGRATDAWYVPVGEVFWNDEDEVVELMRESGRPVLFERARWASKAGGLSYEPKICDPFGILASQLLLVLHGTDVSTIPVERPSEFELTLNVDLAAANPALRPTKSFIRRADKVFTGEAGASP